MSAVATMPVFAFGGQRPADAQCVPLGWPVWMTHMRVSTTGRTWASDLNVFEAAVLDLQAAGVQGPRMLAADLDLDRDLVSLVIVALQTRGLIDGRGEVTKDGYDLVAEQDSDRATHVSGYVASDGRSGAIWPRLLDRLETVETVEPPAPRPDLWPRARIRLEREELNLPLLEHTLPAPGFEGLDSHKRVVDALARRGQVRGVRPLGDPVRGHVLIWAYRRRAEDGPDSWFVDREIRVRDPLGDYDSVGLAESVQRLLNDPKGVRALRRLDDSQVTAQDLARTLLEDAHRRLLLRLGQVPREHPAVRVLASAHQSRADGRLSHALTDTWKAMETVLRHAAFPAEWESAHARLAGGHHANQVLEEAMRRCGLPGPAPTGVLKSLRGPFHAYPGGRPLAGLLVLLAADDQAHPLHALIRELREDRRGSEEAAGWLTDVDALAGARNPQAHGSAPGTSPGSIAVDDLDRWLALTDRTTAHLLTGDTP